MALGTIGRAISLAWTVVSGQTPTPPTGPITKIQSYDTNKSDEPVRFRTGNARVTTSYRGAMDAYITITTPDIAKFAAFERGQKFTDVILTVASAVDRSGASEGTNIVITLSDAELDEKSPIQSGNENDAPYVGTLTFRLNRPVGATEDPTYTVEEAGS